MIFPIREKRGCGCYARPNQFYLEKMLKIVHCCPIDSTVQVWSMPFKLLLIEWSSECLDFPVKIGVPRLTYNTIKIEIYNTIINRNETITSKKDKT